MSSTPEFSAREQIDAFLVSAGWVIQDYKNVDLGAPRGIALREVPLKSGWCDYLLLVDCKAVGVVEAKKVGVTLSYLIIIPLITRESWEGAWRDPSRWNG